MGCCGSRNEYPSRDMPKKEKKTPEPSHRSVKKKSAKSDKPATRSHDPSSPGMIGIIEQNPQHPEKSKIRLGYNSIDEKESILSESQSVTENLGKLIFYFKKEPSYLSKILESLDLKSAEQIIPILINNIFPVKDVEELYLLAIIDSMIKIKRKDCTDTKTFLRENSPTTKLLQAYTKLPQNQKILVTALKSPMKKFLGKNVNLEIDPEKLRTSPTQSSEEITAIQTKNLDNLEKACDLFLQAIYATELPMGLRIICRTLRDVSTDGQQPDLPRLRSLTRDPSEDINVSFIGAFIFLRFFSPALCDLKQIEITDKLSPLNGRNLRLITKTLQGLSNGIVFGDKEKYMTLLNPYLKRQFPDLKRYFAKITDVEPITAQTSQNPLTVSYIEVVFEDLRTFFDLIKSSKQWESVSDSEPAKLVAEIQKKAGKEGLTVAQLRGY